MARPELFEAADRALVNLPDGDHVQRVYASTEMARPELFEAADRALVNLPDGDHVQRVDASPALLTGVNQAGFAEHLDVLHDAEAGQVRKGLHDLGGGAGALAQEVENRAARS